MRNLMLMGMVCLYLSGCTGAGSPTGIVATEAQPENEPPLALVAMQQQLRTLLAASCPKATFALSKGVDGYSLVVDHETQMFMVHGSNMVGKWDEKAHEERGPKHNGFLLRLNVQGKWAGQLMIPQELSRPYWKTYLAEYPLRTEKDRYIWLDFSYGSQTGQKLIARIRESVAEWCKQQ